MMKSPPNSMPDPSRAEAGVSTRFSFRRPSLGFAAFIVQTLYRAIYLARVRLCHLSLKEDRCQFRRAEWLPAQGPCECRA